MKTFLKFSISIFVGIFFVSCFSNTSSFAGGEESPKLPEIGTVDRDCIPATDNNKLEIATWNLEHFPKQGNTTIKKVATLIKKMDVDVIALQEIKDKQFLDELDSYLPDYKTAILRRSDINLAYVYKTSEITLNGGHAFGILREYTSDFAMRTPFVLPIHSKSTNLDILLINVHLKAFGKPKDIEKRKKACWLLKNWIDNKHSNDNVVVLGDMNDEITDPKGENVFQIFIDDKENYHFADYPSHIDHILITNELFDNEDTTYTYKFEKCLDNYDATISDHQPVCLVLKK